MYAVTSSPFSVEAREVPTEPDDELGFLDYRELFDEAVVRLTNVAASMADALAEVGANTRKRTAETRNLLAAKQPSVALAREIFDQSAKDLERFALQLHGEIPQFSQAQQDLLRYLVRAATLEFEMGQVSTDRGDQLIAALKVL